MLLTSVLMFIHSLIIYVFYVYRHSCVSQDHVGRSLNPSGWFLGVHPVQSFRQLQSMHYKSLYSFAFDEDPAEVIAGKEEDLLLHSLWTSGNC